jgi:RNA polymerase sigma-70 factor (ECF subfamily)
MVVQGYLDDLAGAGDASAEPVVRALLAGSVNRLRALCQSLLYRRYPRLTRGPLNLQTDELLGAVVERMIKAMREVRPRTVREFFALANRHMRWELNDLARRLDKHFPAAELAESRASAPAEPSASGINLNLQRILQAIENLGEDDREVFTLVRIQGMTRAEAATVIGVAEKTVQRRLSRSIVHLTEMLSDMQPESLAVDGADEHGAAGAHG